MVKIEDNVIRSEELVDVAGKVLRTLDEQKIFYSAHLRNNLGKNFPVNFFPEDHIEILERPSTLGTKSLILSYVRKGNGIIIDALSNDALKYSMITVKGQFGIKNYEPFAVDSFSNIQMSKKFPSDDFSRTIRELIELTNPNTYFKANFI